MVHRPPVWVVATAGVAIVAVVAVVALRAGDPHEARGNAAGAIEPATPSSTSPTAQGVGSGATTAPVTNAVDHPGEYAVDETELTITDPEQDDRTVDIEVWYPHTGAPFPLVVFAHGFGTSPDNYADFLGGLASSGHVVAAPRSFTTQAFRAQEADPPADQPPGDEPAPEPGAAGDGFDFNGQRLDLVAAIDVLLGPDAPEDLRGKVASTKVTAIGHSDGGVTAAALSFNSLAGDPRVGSGVIISGDYGEFGGQWFPDGSPALLAIHGDSDGVNPVASSVGLYDADGGGPRYLVVVHGAGHLDLLTDDPPLSFVIALITDFIATYVSNDASGISRLRSDTDGNVLEMAGAG